MAARNSSALIRGFGIELFMKILLGLGTVDHGLVSGEGSRTKENVADVYKYTCHGRNYNNEYWANFAVTSEPN
jgi:hypothetical protein